MKKKAMIKYCGYGCIAIALIFTLIANIQGTGQAEIPVGSVPIQSAPPVLLGVAVIVTILLVIWISTNGEPNEKV